MTGRQNVQRIYQKEPTVLRGGKTEQKEDTAKKRGSYDLPLLIAVVFIFAFGLLVIYSGSRYIALVENRGSTYYFDRQLMIGGAGLILAIIISKLNYNWLKFTFCWMGAYAIALFLPLLTLIMGMASNGKTRWLSFFKTSFQPAELAKVGLIISVSVVLDAAKGRLKENKVFWPIFVAAMLPGVLIFKENLSSGFIVMFIVAVLMFVATDRWKMFAIAAGAGLTLFAAAKPIVRAVVEKMNYTSTPSQYWLRRILAWALPEQYTTEAYQTTQGLYAIGSGGMFGRGLGESIQKFGKIPEVQNDMIFSVICEEFGFVGALTVIVIFILIILRIYVVAKNAKDRLGKLLCCGVMAHISIQVILNLSVVTGVFPNTGVTLPFISYGGTAVFCTMFEIGLVLCVSNRTRREN